MQNDIIFALSSGSLPSGVAIIRISGPNAISKCESLISDVMPKPRNAKLCSIVSKNEIIDNGLIIQFPAPNSFTGEDSVELHVHGGLAVVEKLLSILGELRGFRLADAGEFSRRAFENGKLDLTEIEGLSDLIASETEEQRKHAVAQASGHFRKKLESWRESLVRSRAFIEAELDFADEDDVPGSVSEQVWSDVSELLSEIKYHLTNGNRGEIIRNGFRIALLGKPNAGKSSLLNALAREKLQLSMKKQAQREMFCRLNWTLQDIRF